MPKCKGCGTRCERRGPVALCGADACFKKVSQDAYEKQRKARERQAERARKKQKQKDSGRKKELRKRTGKDGWYEAIQTEVNWYCKHVVYKGNPCYTCDLPQRPDDSPQKFHAGHFMPKKQVDPRRFMVEQIRPQCFSCNSANSGRQGEFEKRLRDERGDEWVDWIMAECNHVELKEQFPTWQDLEAELKRWRKINREAKARIGE